MLQEIRRSISRFAWNITPRCYVCRDVILIKWMQNEYIIKRKK